MPRDSGSTLAEFHVDQKAYGILTLSGAILSTLRDSGSRGLVLACVGTDRATGDCLGPLVGTMVQERKLPKTHVFGTLEDPFHAANMNKRLPDVLKAVSENEALFIAVDATLTEEPEHIGRVIMKGKPLRPGTGVGKSDLPQVGDCCIVGVVNVQSPFSYLSLANARLYTVMEMAKLITEAVFDALTRFVDPEKDSHPLDLSAFATSRVS